MANTILTPTAVTRKALRILHQKLNFVGNINRQYDDSFSKSGAKIGDTLKIRLPNQYTVRTGTTMSAQDTAENSISLAVQTMKGVDINFNDAELSLSLDDFGTRVLDPAMAVLAAAIESDALSMVLDVYNQAPVATPANALDFKTVLNGKKILDDNLAPPGDRTALLQTQNSVDLVDALKGLFQDSGQISKQYKEGMMGRSAGLDFMQNTLLSNFTSGTETTGTMAVNGANQTGASVTVTNGSSKTLKKGDVITFVGCNRCHQETKADTGVKQQFVVTADVSSVGTSIPISPAIVVTGATQNVFASPTTGQTIAKAIDASKVINQSLLFHKDAFTFATADLIMPRGVHFAAREVQDGISMRIWQGTDIINGKFPCRIDVLYGFKTIRPQLACRTASNAA